MTSLAMLHAIDWAILAIYVLGMLALGWHYSRKQESMKEYFTGSGSMNSVLIGISLYATLMSTLSYFSFPGELIAKGPVLMIGFIALPVIYLIVGYVLLPVYMKQRVTSAYELLESRLGVGARLAGAVMFLTLRLVWMSVMIYLTSHVLLTVMAMPPSAQPYVALAFGFVAITYTSMGGLRAVVITDAFQFCLLFSGAALTIAVVTWRLGGFGWFPTQWAPNWDSQPLLPSSLYTRVTVAGTLLAQLVWAVATAGGDQTAVQRFMSTKDAAAARRSYLVHCSAGIAVACLLALVGFALLGYYNAHPELIPGGQSVDHAADRLFPLFIAAELPVGITGLVIAGVFAAAMSSIDSGVNSITAVVSTDFLDRFGKGFKTERGHVVFTKVLAFGIGAVIVFASMWIDPAGWNFMDLVKRAANLLVCPIFALFFLAVFVPYANGVGAIVGMLYGLSAAVLIAFWGQLTGDADLSFQWIGVVALIVNIPVGCAISKLAPNRAPTRRKAIVVVGMVAALVLIVGCLLAWGRAHA